MGRHPQMQWQIREGPVTNEPPHLPLDLPPLSPALACDEPPERCVADGRRVQVGDDVAPRFQASAPDVGREIFKCSTCGLD
eukprot:7439951-Pyramimonas_sp.AAC.1